MTMIRPLRRFGIAAGSVALGAVLFHAQVASALVTRGDDVMRAGDANGAVRYYARAARIDSGSAIAADRLAFALLTRRGRGDAERAYAAADAALRADAGLHADAALHAPPNGVTLLVDRAFAAEQLSGWRRAESDFAKAASLARDPRYAHLAAQMARRAGDRDAERAHLRAALAFDSKYAPARALLERLGR